MVEINLLEGAEVYVTTKLSSVLTRINKIYNCLPSDLHSCMDNVRSIVSDTLIGLGCCLNVSNDGLDFLDKVSLYTELRKIYNDLNECSLLIFDNCDITFAFSNVGLVMEKMAEYDSVFRWCYNNNVKKRVLNKI